MFNHKIYIETYGCQMNFADTEVILSILKSQGYEILAALLHKAGHYNDLKKVLSRLEALYKSTDQLEVNKEIFEKYRIPQEEYTLGQQPVDGFNEQAADSADRAALVERVSRNKQTLEDLEGGCITISNLGGFGIDSFIPIVIPGQCSIIGVGRITDTVMPIDRKMIVRKLMNLTLAVDHKVVNGAEAAQFLDFVKKLLESPGGL